VKPPPRTITVDRSGPRLLRLVFDEHTSQQDLLRLVDNIDAWLEPTGAVDKVVLDLHAVCPEGLAVGTTLYSSLVARFGDADLEGLDVEVIACNEEAAAPTVGVLRLLGLHPCVALTPPPSCRTPSSEGSSIG